MLLLSTDSLSGYGLNRIFGLVKEAGFDGIDLAMDPKNFDTLNADYIKELVQETGVPVVSIQGPQKGSQKNTLEAIELAKTLGVKVVILQPPRLLNFRYIKWLTTDVPILRQKEEISIAMENASSETFLGIIPEHAMSNLNELKKFKHAALDTTRVAMKKQDLMRVVTILKKFLVHIHISNVKHGKGYQLPDNGILPLESFLTKLKKEKYKGAISFKINPKFLKAGEDKLTLRHLKDCKDYYEEFFVNVPNE